MQYLTFHSLLGECKLILTNFGYSNKDKDEFGFGYSKFVGVNMYYCLN